MVLLLVFSFFFLFFSFAEAVDMPICRRYAEENFSKKTQINADIQVKLTQLPARYQTGENKL